MAPTEGRKELIPRFPEGLILLPLSGRDYIDSSHWCQMMVSESGLAQRTSASVLAGAVRALKKSRFTAALTGAGISAASGISPFRGNGGLWDQFPPEQYATLETFLSNPKKAWEMFAALGHQVCNAVPNAAHESLARLEQMGRLHAIITQNVDELHTRAGNKTVLELHGSHRELICLQCSLRQDVEDWGALGVPPKCQCGAIMKPNVTLFGELLAEGVFEEATRAVEQCDLLLVVGTSAEVAPASDLPRRAKQRGASLIEVNTEPTWLSESLTDFFLAGRCEEILTQLVQGVRRRTP